VKKLDATYINTANKIKVLDLIRSSEVISRAELSKRANLSAPTITRIVAGLVNRDRIVEEVGTGASSGGRPPELVRFAGSDKFVIGIDLGRTHLDAIISDLNARVATEIRIPTFAESGYEEVIGRTSLLIRDIVDRSGLPATRILGVGMAVAGLVDRPDVPYPMVFDNVTRVMALGEVHFGIGQKYRDFVCINVGYGIGAGVVTGGQPFFGAHGMSGEFGHIVVDPGSPVRCLCGNQGCLEALASGRGISIAAQERLARGEKSALGAAYGADPASITARAVAEAASDGDTVATEVLTRAAEYLGLGIVNLVNLFDPEAIVIGGGVAEAGPVFLDTVRDVVSKRSLSSHARQLSVMKSSFGSRSAVMGAISLVLDRVLSFQMQGIDP
jgi:predicted NBD/HSP70 family sugar kinase